MSEAIASAEWAAGMGSQTGFLLGRGGGGGGGGHSHFKTGKI